MLNVIGMKNSFKVLLCAALVQIVTLSSCAQIKMEAEWRSALKPGRLEAYESFSDMHYCEEYGLEATSRAIDLYDDKKG